MAQGRPGGGPAVLPAGSYFFSDFFGSGAFVVDFVSVDAVVSVLAGISFLHATASASRVIVANFLMLSPLSNQTRNVR